MKDEDIKLPEIDQAMFQFSEKVESPNIWDHIEKWSVSKAGLQASTMANNIDLAIAEAMQEYARQAVRMNAACDRVTKDNANSWLAVSGALNAIVPGWLGDGDHPYKYAIETIQNLAEKAAAATPKPSDPEPFDLARAMAGEPIVTRDGRKVKFLVHVPEFKPTHRVVAAIEGNDYPDTFYKDGRCYENLIDENDLFMAHKPKRTVWVNVWKNRHGYLLSSAHATTDQAAYSAQKEKDLGYLTTVHPIEIDA